MIYSILYERVKLSEYFTDSLLYCSQQNQRLDIGLSKHDETWGDCTVPAIHGHKKLGKDMIPSGNLT